MRAKVFLSSSLRKLTNSLASYVFLFSWYKIDRLFRLCLFKQTVEEEAYEEVEEEAPKDEAEIQVVFYFINNSESCRSF